MAGCVSCFILPLILFLFHRFIQPIILKYFVPWEKKAVTNNTLNNSCQEENKQNATNQKYIEEDINKRLKED